MKIYKILYVVIFCISLSSCNKWLTIEPTDQLSEETLYSNADGFNNQVNGVYKALAKPSLYGREMNWGLVDAIAQYYDRSKMRFTIYNAYTYGASSYSYDYSLTLSIINRIWEESYNAIANCNDIIVHTEAADSSKFAFKEKERLDILGEAHALRAMLHFDMLRLFAPAPIKNSKEAFIPYVKDFPTLIPKKQTTDEVLKNIIADLEEAERLTASLDTSKQGRAMINNFNRRLRLYTTSSVPRFLSHRGYRLNHYAIKGLLARVSLYAGDKDKALKYAQELIKLNWFKFSDQIAYGDTKLSSDIIFALYDNKLTDYYRALNPQEDQFMALLDYDGIFGKDGVSGDARARLFSYNVERRSYRSAKITENKGIDNYEKFSNKMIPMLRISEMYYIAAECLFSGTPTVAADKTLALKYLNDVRKGRCVTTPMVTADNQQEFDKLVLNEMRREMFGEGQLFFYYKRLNSRVETSKGEFLLLDKEFVLPIPHSNDVN